MLGILPANVRGSQARAQRRALSANLAGAA